jgi:hypothetical protein
MIGISPKTTPIPIQNFDPVPQFVGEDKEVAAQGILLQRRLHVGIQAIKPEKRN